MNKKNLYASLLFFFALPVGNVFAQDSNNTTPQEDRFQLETSVQAGLEYDSNVFKTFNSRNGDLLTRFLLKNKGDYWVTPIFSAGWDYQGGGKKFIHDDAQDLIIQDISAQLHWIPNSHVHVIFDPNLKFQNERNKLDAAGDDINEDFLSTKALLKLLVSLPGGYYIQPQGSFTYFHFYPNETFSFSREETGASVEKRSRNVAVGVAYDFFKQQFNQSFRQDTIHEITPYIQYLKRPFVALSYSYQVNHSNDPLFSFSNHKINLLTSFLFGKYRTRTDDSQPEARFSLHLIGTLQLKNYSSVFAENPEGERFLVTSSEDENFNNLIVKFNYHFRKHWAVETKYTRISNELTNQRTGFARSLYYGGLRCDF